MNEFDWTPGTLPEGWQLGLPLGITNDGFRAGPEAGLTQRGPFGMDCMLNPPPVFMRFHERDVPRVKAWLAWYYAH